MILAEMSVGLTKAQALDAPKIFRVKKNLGERNTLKLLAAIIKSFCDSVRVPNRPDAADIIDVADVLMNTYTHDSIKDIILAFKEARTSGKTFFQVLDQPTLFGIINDYFDAKAKFLYNTHRDRVTQGASDTAKAVKALGDSNQKLLHSITDRIPTDAPNHDQLRRRLSLVKAREAHGLITPAQAEQQRATFRKARVPKSRADWKASPEAQQRIDERNRREEYEIAKRYRSTYIE
jgi:citrate lyase beta subunit